MDNLPDLVVTFAVVAVGVSPGLAILSTPLIARLLHQALWPRPEIGTRSRREPSGEEAAGAAGSRV
jgi:hypothetical protein